MPKIIAAADLFMMARGSENNDADLFRAIAEYRRLIDIVNSGGWDDDEVARLCDAARPWRDKVERYQPVTLNGVLVALEFASEIDEDPDYWPEGAIDGLRAILETQTAGATR